MTEEEKKKRQGVSNDNDNQEIHTSVKDWQGNEHKIDYTPETGAVITPPKANENENANDNLNPNDNANLNVNDNTPDEIDLRAEEQNAEAEQRWKEARERVESLFKPTESEDERKKREKREKAVRIAAGISDMASALANLHFTGRYAPNAYTGKPTLSEAAKKRYDIAKAEREKDKNYNDRLQLALNTLDKDLMTTKLNIEKGRQAAKDRAEAARLRKEIADANRKSREDEGQKNRDVKESEGEKNRKNQTQTAYIRKSSSGGGGGGKSTVFVNANGNQKVTMPPNKSVSVMSAYNMIPGGQRFMYKQMGLNETEAVQAFLKTDDSLVPKVWAELIRIRDANTEAPANTQTKPKGKGKGRKAY